MTIVNHHSEVCLDAFINCEYLLQEIGKKKIRLSSHIAQLLKECAHVCVGTFHAIKNHSVNTAQLALLCMGICDECAEECDAIDNDQFKQCAQVCRYCSNTVSELAIVEL